MIVLTTIGTIIGIIASLITIGAYLKEKGFKTNKLKFIYLIFVTLLLGLYTYQLIINLQMKNIERQASVILNKTELNTIGEKRGYVYECFIFIEKNKERFPEAYKYAVTYMDSNNILIRDSSARIEGHKLDEACDTMKGFISGISIVKE